MIRSWFLELVSNPIQQNSWENCHGGNKHSPMPGENVKSSSLGRGLNACLNQKTHLKSHRPLTCLIVYWSTALPKLHSVKSAMPLTFKFGSSTIEYYLTSKELKILKTFVLLNFKRTEIILGKRVTEDNSAPLPMSPKLPKQGITQFWVCLHIHSYKQASQSPTTSWQLSCLYLSYMVAEFTTEMARETLPHHL